MIKLILTWWVREVGEHVIKYWNKNMAGVVDDSTYIQMVSASIPPTMWASFIEVQE